jgi:hypothetical protein
MAAGSAQQAEIRGNDDASEAWTTVLAFMPATLPNDSKIFEEML